jgi:hypothetical protein
MAAMAVALVMSVATPASAASNPKTKPTYKLKCRRNTARLWMGVKWTADNQCPAWLVIVNSYGTYFNVDPGARFGPRHSAQDMKGETVVRVFLHVGQAICDPTKPCWEVKAGTGGRFEAAHDWVASEGG